MIDLETAYRLRAEAVDFINRVGGDVLIGPAVAAELHRLHPKLALGDARHIAERVAACWGQTGLDYEKAPVRGDGTRTWYPVPRGGHLQRITIDYLTGGREVQSELQRQAEAMLAQADALEAGGAGR